jgi:hypothetical protein
MKKRAFICVGLFILCAFVQENTILWAENKKLSWNDFQGKPDESSPYKAKTESTLDIKISTKGMEAVIVMQTNFSKTASWVKTKTDLLLKHEQTHFDITELWTRKFKQKLKGKTFPAHSFQRTLNSLHGEIQRESHAMQALYDKETNHSIIEKEQEKWTKKIGADLKSLSEFSGSTVTCKLSK